jgi:F-type H+-transporting ATPase subunit gamma
MGSQKEIRVRISSTKKTMKITSAMKLVAAAKVNKMQKILMATRPYSHKVSELFVNLVNSLSQDILEQNPLLKTKPESETKKILLIVISSDRGLCGGYNANIIKATNKRIKELKAQSKEVSLMTIGRKAKTNFNKSIYKADNVTIVESFVNLSSIPSSLEADLISNKAINLFLDGSVDRIEIITTKFINLVSNEILVNQFLPIDSKNLSSTQAVSSSEVLLEPDPQTLISTLAPMYTENRVYQALLEAVSSELAARMTAMSNATNNAKEVIYQQVLAYNKARQASITQEISEIVGGAAALG